MLKVRIKEKINKEVLVEDEPVPAESVSANLLVVLEAEPINKPLKITEKMIQESIYQQEWVDLNAQRPKEHVRK
ncbi:unnamed protein product [Rhizophagus irregularis]|nr:unnamed protein product [Rhizophagus irregularis]